MNLPRGKGIALLGLTWNGYLRHR